MPNYTSPSPANVALNGNQTTWWIPAKNNSTIPVTNVVVTVTVAPTSGLQLLTFNPEVGTFNPTTGNWNVGTLAPGATKWLKIVTAVADIGLAPFTVTSVISGDGVDSNALNNTLVQTVTSVVTSATAGAIDDPHSCSCVNVAANDTPCNFGTTTYVLDVPSITNSTEYWWDDATGEGKFIPVNPNLNITFNYSIWCDSGTGAVQISGPALVTIDKLFSDISSFDHTIAAPVPYSALCPQEITVLSAQYPSLDLSKYCWRILKNANGDATSGEPVDCEEDIDTRTFFVCSEVDCTTPETPCPCPTDELPVDVLTQFPEGYEAEKGDTVVIYHPNAMSVWTYDGTLWNKWSCGCIFKISQDEDNDLTLGSDNAPFFDLSSMTEIIELQDKVVVGIAFTGTTTKTLTLTFDDGSTLTATFTDLQGGGGGATYVQVSDTCSINMSISGTGTVVDPYIISASYNDGGPLYNYVSGLPGDSTTTVSLLDFFDMPCPAGCTAVYTLNGYPTDVFQSVAIIGTNLNYSIKSTAPGGTHDINVQRECTTIIL